MCGVAGYVSRSERQAARQVMEALYAEQHRGQESCGIAASDGQWLRLHKAMGYVREVFPNEILETMPGFAALGHVRYPTRGSSSLLNAQPYLIETLRGPIYAIASNGDVVNYDEVAMDLRQKGVHFTSSNDGELLGRFIVYQHEVHGLEIPAAIALLMRRIRGAYSALFLTSQYLYVFRDRHGFRPLLIGQVGDDVAVASESCALDILRAEAVREVEPGEILAISRHGMHSTRTQSSLLTDLDEEPVPTHHCIFELIYFARPDSYQFGEYVYEVRQRIGAKLASYDEEPVDVVVPVPDSANFIALGYAAARGVPFNFGLIRNHYVGRTFIRPDQYMRDESVRTKFNPLKDFFNGKRVVMVDDSIVRGTTIRKIVRMIKAAGAREVHLRIGCPPVRFSCFYGIDTPTRKELIANNMSLEEICTYTGADSLKFLKIEDLRDCVSGADRFCYACLDGHYPEPRHPAEAAEAVVDHSL
ncbi:MAG: amidophosphoribosyltransferase [Calditrichaeota bacterium]|nr:MAG: amidophosphoribosyltransferase [Calditrichota bacterium]